MIIDTEGVPLLNDLRRSFVQTVPSFLTGVLSFPPRQVQEPGAPPLISRSLRQSVMK